ncbi:MAG: hypothetical protein P4N60_10990 [Verrucomicrobiae bacterium]|nr:hypothetical protein [Verrucomicrobiae bacterium]
MMTLFGKSQVLFKFTPKAPAGQPAKELSFMLGEGERQENVEVTKIDMQTHVASFINHGVAQDVELSDTAKLTAPATMGGGAPVMAAGGGIPLPPVGARPMLPAGFGGRARGGNPGAAPDAGLGAGATALSPSGSAAKSTDPQHSSDNLTPEERAILIEAQRSVWKQQGNPAAAILPPTTGILGRNIVNELNGETPTTPAAPGGHN